MASKLEPYELSGEKLELLQRCFSEPDVQILSSPEAEPFLKVYEEWPQASELLQRMKVLGIPVQVLKVVFESVNRTWEKFRKESIRPSDFMRVPDGACYEIVTITGKGRGIIASRKIEAGETILQEAPIIIMPQPVCAPILLTLPQKALEAILLLHNAKPGDKRFAARLDIPKHRLLDYLVGTLTTNCFGTTNNSHRIGVLLLTGSLFNHSRSPNCVRRWDDATKQQIFTSVRDIEKGEELEVDYLPGEIGKARAERLKEYGTGLS